MHAAMLIAMMVAATGQPAVAPTDQPPALSSNVLNGCDCQEGCVGEAGSNALLHRWLCDWFGPMPQTCYSPRFGCYPGNGRDIHRYPAFHGYYYRNPYNYRHYFDYPWHASPRDPLGYFVYQTEAVGPGVVAPAPAPPAPVPAAPGSSQAKVPRYAEPRLLVK